jgi:hypothetical protein
MFFKNTLSFKCNDKQTLRGVKSTECRGRRARQIAKHVSSLALLSNASVKLAVGDKSRAMNHPLLSVNAFLSTDVTACIDSGTLLNSILFL